MNDVATWVKFFLFFSCIMCSVLFCLGAFISYLMQGGGN